jgi:hypothetical protein
MKTPEGQPTIRRLRPEVLHFFDTNFLVLPEAKLPLLKHVPDGPRWITETVRQEAIEKLGATAERDIDARYEALRFRDLYRLDPGICPTYYYYVLAMYNPANVGSEDFLADMYNSRVIKNVALTEQEKRAYQRDRRQLSSGRTHDDSGRPKGDGHRFLERLASRTRKKATTAMRDKHPAYLRDIRSLALILYNCLSTRQNTIYYTTDGDPIALFLKWLDSMTMWMTLVNASLEKITSAERGHIAGGGRIDVRLDAAAFVERRYKLFEGFVLDRRKKQACRFTIKRWNQEASTFDEDVYLWFDDKVAEGLTRAHGPLSCHFTMNAERGNWVDMRYHWPPAKEDLGKLRVNLARKRIVNQESLSVSPEVHDDRCRYRQEDASGEMADWSQFVVPRGPR